MNDIVTKLPNQELTNAVPAGVSPVVHAMMTGSVNPDIVDKLLDAQAKHDRMEARKSYNAGMPGFRRDLKPAQKTGKNTHLRTTYATFDDILQSASGPLANNGFNIEFTQSQEGNSISVTARVTHAEGHSEQTTLSAVIEGNKGINSLQAMGLTISYLKRYTMAALLGIATEENDGQADAPPAIEMITESDQSNLIAVVEEVGKDPAKWIEFMKAKYPETGGLLAMPKSHKAPAIAQIRKSAEPAK
jgi:hypothetical protein